MAYRMIPRDAWRDCCEVLHEMTASVATVPNPEHRNRLNNQLQVLWANLQCPSVLELEHNTGETLDRGKAKNES